MVPYYKSNRLWRMVMGLVDSLFRPIALIVFFNFFFFFFTKIHYFFHAFKN